MSTTDDQMINGAEHEPLNEQQRAWREDVDGRYSGTCAHQRTLGQGGLCSACVALAPQLRG